MWKAVRLRLPISEEVNMTKLRLLLLTGPILWIASASAVAFAQPTNDTAMAKVLIDQERKLMESIAKGDKAAFRGLVAADGVWARAGSFVPNAVFADAVDQFKVTKWDIGTPHVLWVDPTTAVLAYVWTGAGTFNDRDLAPHLIASTVWTRRGGNWVAVYHHESDASRGQ
jgi:hypothetical protein